MNKLLSIAEAANLLGVSTQTLRRWEKEGKICPKERTKGNQRRFNIDELRPNLNHKPCSKISIGYARTSSHDQKEDLNRQIEILEMFCSGNRWSYEIISDLGSGMNYNKKGLKKLLNLILEKRIDRLILTHKDRLLRFGAELIFSLCEAQNIEVVIINRGDQPSFEEELASDVLEIITVFSARLYGSRSDKNKQLIQNLKKGVDDPS